MAQSIQDHIKGVFGLFLIGGVVYGCVTKEPKPEANSTKSAQTNPAPDNPPQRVLKVQTVKEFERAQAKAKGEREAREAAAAEAKRVAEAKEKTIEAICRRDLKCWADEHEIWAQVKCQKEIARLAKYDLKWTNTGLGNSSIFTRVKWKDQDAGQITYIGDRVQFQNGFGAFEHHNYTCDFDPGTRTVLNVTAQLSRATAASLFGPAPSGEPVGVARKVIEANFEKNDCPRVASAQRLEDGSVTAECSNSERFRVFSGPTGLVAMKCSALTLLGIEGC
jgi:hypothetical protein